MPNRKDNSAGVARRKEILEYLIDYKMDNQGNTPSAAEISRVLYGKESSKPGIMRHLRKMHEDGTIWLSNPNSSTIEVVIPGAQWLPPKGMV